MKKKGYSLNVVTSCISTTMVLLLLGTVVFFVMMGIRLSDSLRENFTITLMLDDEQPINNAYAMQTALRLEPCVKSLRYISKAKALKEQVAALGTDPSEFLGANPIPASFELHLKADYANNDSIARILPRLKRMTYVMDASYPKELMSSVNDNIRKISTVMLIIALLLTFVSFELINNTIRLSVYSKRLQIHTMKLVGASWGFIRRPFVKRAFWIGVVSALMAGTLLAGGVYVLTDFEPGLIELLSWDVAAITLGVIFVCGIILTYCCAFFSVNRFLKMPAGKLYKM